MPFGAKKTYRIRYQTNRSLITENQLRMKTAGRIIGSPNIGKMPATAGNNLLLTKEGNTKSAS
jgi:hypothetical protein